MAELRAQDLIEMDSEDSRFIRVIGCTQTLKLVRSYQASYGPDVTQWPLPEGNSHSELLLKEALQKQRGQWQFPYPHQEICHCRAVSTERVDQAILQGAHNPQKVSRLTSASTACGTCRVDVEKILKFRLAS